MKKAWSQQAKLKMQSIPTPEGLLATINKCKHPRNKALMAIAYLTGGRISEIVKENYLRKTVFKRDPNNELRILRIQGVPQVDHINKIQINYPGITKKDITYAYLNQQQIMLINMQNRKNREYKRKNIPVLIEREHKFVRIIENYLEDINDEQPLFDFQKSQAYNIIKKELGLNCHFLRDIRATHLVTVHNLREFQLVMFMGWTDPRPAKRYVRMRWQDIWS